MFFFTSVYDFAYQILADILSIDRLLVYKKLTAKIGLCFFFGVGVETTTYLTTFVESRKSSDEDGRKRKQGNQILKNFKNPVSFII